MTRHLLHTALLTLGLCAATAGANAQAPAAAAPANESVAMPYKTVAEALAGLKARDGNGTIVTDGGDGWVIVNEPMASAQWTFTPAGHAAYPAVVRRVIRRGANRAVSVDVATVCEAPAAACAELVKTFEGMNERITQAAGARNRQPPTGP